MKFGLSLPGAIIASARLVYSVTPLCSRQIIDIIVGVEVVVAPLIQDIRYALRLGRKSPAFFACVILLLALGIGLNSAIFSLLDALLLRPLPVRKPGELVRLVQVAAPLGPRSFFTYNTYRALAQRNKCFAAVFGYSESNVAVRDNGGAHSIRCHIVSGSFFSALGVQPLHGRTLTPADERHASDVLPAVLSNTLWMRSYHGDPSVIGKKLTLQDRAFTIVEIGRASCRERV